MTEAQRNDEPYESWLERSREIAFRERDALAARLAEAEALLARVAALPLGRNGFHSYPLTELRDAAMAWLAADSASVADQPGVSE